jgi:sodium-dependent dicarboxylate transporter 2/3/5
VTDTRPETRRIHLAGGPMVFLLLVVLPLPSVPYPVRASIGLLVWMSWWWIFQPVHLAVTGFLPLAVLSVFNFLPVTTILPAYAQQLVILLIGANILAIVWRRWGLDKRIAIVSLLGVGTSTRRQILVWFGVATILSTFLPNTVVAASMMPIVLAMLRFIGIEDVGKSAFGSALLIAVAWGTSVGGAGTPLAGAPNLLTIGLIEDQIIDH